jgi:RNA polymerase sigma-70 factor (ECF subfamily)
VDEAAFEHVLRRARQRAPDALEAVYELYSRRVYGLLFRLTGSHDIAEDLLQGTFLRVVRMLPAYEHSGRFEAWIFRIAANLVRDRARQAARQRRFHAADSSDGGGVDGQWRAARPPPQPDELLGRREAGDRLAEALARLSESEREVLLLRHYSDLSFREIAEMLDIPIGTTLSRAHRALQRLRRDLGEDVWRDG